MWLFTPLGMFSVVCAHAPGGGPLEETLMIRARDVKHLKALQAKYTILKERKIVATPGNDYAFRIIAPKEDVAQVIAGLTLDIEYTNFKSEAGRYPDSGVYVNVLHSIWSTALRLQEQSIFRSPAPKKRGSDYAGQLPLDVLADTEEADARFVAVIRNRAAEYDLSAMAELEIDPLAAYTRPLRRGNTRGAKGRPMEKGTKPKPGLLIEDAQCVGGVDKATGATVVKSKTAKGKADESVEPTDAREKTPKD